MKKKILIVADTYFPKIDGIMRFLQEIVPRINDDFDITLLVPNFGKSWNEHNEIKLKVSNLIKLSGYQSMSLSPANVIKIKKAVKEADVVFVQGPALISAFSIYLAKKYHKTVIYYIHLILWELYEKNLPKMLRIIASPMLKRFTTSWYNKCNLLIVPYKSLIQELNDLGVTTKKEVVRLGVDTHVFHPPKDKSEAKQMLGIDPSYTVIGYVGRISKEKNISVLLEAAKRLQPQFKIMLLVVGSGTKGEMRKFLKSKNTMLPGFQNNIAPYYQAMDIFVMPSFTETTSLATLEAMSCGVPVITTKVGFLKEYVIRGYNGLLFPRNNAYALTLLLKKLLMKKKLRQKMGANARKIATAFSWDKTAHRIKEILQRY